jgi:Protein of unknown function (DUF3606)
MADDRTLKGPQDRTRISLSEDYEVRYWCKKFGVTPDVLRADKLGRFDAAMAGDNQILLVDEDRHCPSPLADRRGELRDLFGQVLARIALVGSQGADRPALDLRV